MKPGILFLSATLCGFCAASLYGQNTVFTYQGRVQTYGTNFNGAGQFKFALVTATNTGTNVTYTTFWSNDGSSIDGSEPASYLSVGVSNGLFNVILGNTTVSNMSPIAETLFAQSSLLLRIWFNDGLHGSAVLDPPQPLTPSPYAIAAANIAGVLKYDLIQTGISFGTISGGAGNVIQVGGDHATIGGGTTNVVAAAGATVSGGELNTIGLGSSNSVISGGWSNVVQPGVTRAFIGGGRNNLIAASGAAGVIAGGTFNDIGSGDPAISNTVFNIIGGGNINTNFGNFSIILGGYNNTIGYLADGSSIGGGTFNSIIGSANLQVEAIISGGYGNKISTNTSYAAIGGGYSNEVTASYGIVAGGNNNSANGTNSTISGGSSNSTYGTFAVVGGGYHNAATGQSATIGGGSGIYANGAYSTVPGGLANAALGISSFAAGQNAWATNDGTFVWNDRTSPLFQSTGPNQFLIHASGGVGIGLSNPAQLLDVAGRIRLRDGTTGNAGMWLYTAHSFGAGGFADTGFIGVLDSTRIGFYGNDPRGGPGWGLTFDTLSGNVGIGIGAVYPTYKLQVGGVVGATSFTSTSDRRFKKNISPLDHALEKILQLRGVSYNWRRDEYPAMNFEDKRQIGLIAQEVYSVIPEAVAEDKDGVHSIAYNQIVPVMVEAIKELARSKHSDAQNKTFDELKQQLKETRAENAELKRRLDVLEKAVSTRTSGF